MWRDVRQDECGLLNATTYGIERTTESATGDVDKIGALLAVGLTDGCSPVVGGFVGDEDCGSESTVALVGAAVGVDPSKIVFVTTLLTPADPLAPARTLTGSVFCAVRSDASIARGRGGVGASAKIAPAVAEWSLLIP